MTQFRHTLKSLEVIAALLSLCLFAGCAQHEAYPNRPLTLVCPWAAGGGTDRVSRQMAFYLEQELGQPVNVINATGGQGVTGHSRGLRTRPDGYTLSMMTLELSMLHWRGLTDLDWTDTAPLMSLNEDPAALIVKGDSEWNSAAELATAVAEKPGKLRASGTAALGAWHLALASWLISLDRPPSDINWIPSQGANPSLQELMSGDIDIVCCSVPEARALLNAGEVRCLGIMSGRTGASLRLPGLDEIPSLDCELKGWRGLAVAKDTPPDIQKTLVAALRRIVSGQTVVAGRTFPEFMDGEGFDRTARPTTEFAHFLEKSDRTFGELLDREEFRNVASGPVGPMVFPTTAFALCGLSLLMVYAGNRRTQAARGSESALVATPPGAVNLPADNPRWISFAGVVAAILLFAFAGDTLGFVLTSGVVIAGLSIQLGARSYTAGLVAVTASAVIYQFFVYVLRVPLPTGLLWW
ncbi:MAG: tripartite tricarboxylate transporter substrate-binding protein [Planctomycetaceae bacterium]